MFYFCGFFPSFRAVGSGGIIGLILSLLVLCGALIVMVKLLHSLVMGQAKKVIMKAARNAVTRNALRPLRVTRDRLVTHGWDRCEKTGFHRWD